MKRLLLLLILNSFIGLAQNDFNLLDKDGKKHGVWKGFYPESKHLRYEGTFNHGQETGVFNYFDDTKNADIIGVRTFSTIDNAAYTIFYDQKKNIVSEGKSVGKLNEGIWKYYHFESKEIMTLENYKNGVLEGVRKVFFKNGKIAEECSYKKGIKDGSYKKYLENGTQIETSNYKNNQYDGQAIYKNINGSISSKGIYKNGKKSGIWQFWDPKTKKLVNKNMDLQQKKFVKKA